MDDESKGVIYILHLDDEDEEGPRMKETKTRTFGRLRKNGSNSKPSSPPIASRQKDPDYEPDVIEISSDSEDEPLALRSKRSQKLRHKQASVARKPRHSAVPLPHVKRMDTAGAVKEPYRGHDIHLRQPHAKTLVDDLVADEGRKATTNRGRPPFPAALRASLTKLRKEFPFVKCRVLRDPSDDLNGWRVRCLHGDCERRNELYPVEPDMSFRYFKMHLTRRHRKLFPSRESTADSGRIHEETPSTVASTSASAASSLSSALNRGTKAGDNIIERFLTELGLSPGLARILRRVGICDEARIDALGRLSGAALNMLKQHLADEGLDYAACLIVCEGLRSRAGAPSDSEV